jgi:hypothetical protein
VTDDRIDSSDDLSEGGDSDDELLRELMALAAVDALDAGDMATLDVLLAERPDLRAEYADLRAAAATMADAVAEPPPPALRAGVLAAIAGVEQDRAAAPVTPPPPSPRRAAPNEPDEPASAPPTVSAPPSAPAPVTPLRPRRSRGWLIPVLSAAAAAALIIGVGAVVRRDDGPPGDLLAEVLEDPDHVVMAFDGDLTGLSMIWSPDHGAAVVSGSGLAPPDGTDVYELWRIEGDGAPVAVRTFRPDSVGVVEELLDDMEAPGDTTSFAVTVEPDGGSEAPTSPVIAQAS